MCQSKTKNEEARKRKPSSSYYGIAEKYEYQNTSKEIRSINSIAKSKGLSYGQMVALERGVK